MNIHSAGFGARTRRRSGTGGGDGSEAVAEGKENKTPRTYIDASLARTSGTKMRATTL